MTTGWSLSGITRFASGFPVTLYNNTDSSLLGTMPNGINNNGVDTPYFIPGNLEINANPRNGRPASIPRSSRPTSVPISGHTGQCSAAVLLRTRPRKLRYGAQKDLPSPKARRWNSAWRVSTSSIMRSSSERQRSMATSAARVRPDRECSAAPTGADGGEAPVLVLVCTVSGPPRKFSFPSGGPETTFLGSCVSQ